MSAVQSRLAFNEAQQLEIVVDRIKTKTDLTKREIDALLVAAQGLLAVFRHGNWGEDADAVIAKIQRIISLLLVLRIQLTATYATMGPFGWILAGLGTVGLVYTIEDFMHMFG